MKRINNKCILILGIIIGITISVTTVYAVDAYIESNKVSYTNHNKTNVEEAIDELYERSGIHKDKWVDPILNGADPVLKEPLIPVEIKPNGEVYYANENSEWYNYSEKRWANAVILTDTASKYSVGQHILEKDIESYFVWIPRYQYRIWDLGEYENAIDIRTMQNSQDDKDTSFYKMFGKARIIDIKFGNTSVIPKMNESEAEIDKYYTHPAFTLGEKDLNGIWVGKFETGYKGALNSTSAQVNREEPNSIIIKPDEYSWRSISVKNAFMTSFKYKSNANNHNINLDPHMMKNTEWGAVAYLSHSAYGIGTEININNTSDYKTGYSSYNADQSSYIGTTAESSDKTQTQPWDTQIGYLASTTGNISGIYDISGGAWEYMAAFIDDNLKNSEFLDDELTTYKDYLNFYKKDSTNTLYKNRILGDATGEMGPFYMYYETTGLAAHTSWYSDYANFVSSDCPWFARGGDNVTGILAGAFYFSCRGGDAFRFITFRLILSP